MRNAPRFTALGLVFSASLAFPLTAAADETLSGSCATTLQGARANGLVLDAGAPLNLPGKLTIALDSQATARQEQALLSLPVGDTVRALGIGNSPQVRGLCTGAQNAVNAVGDTTQGVLGGAQPKPGKPGPAPAPVPHEPGKPEPKPSDPGAETPSTEINPVVPIDGGGPGAVVIPGFFLNPYPLPADFSSAAPVIALDVPSGKAPSLSVDDYPVVVADRSGTAQALVAPQAPARLPLLLAVLAVSVVAAGLLRAWMYRKTS
ncbi:hypothetical protein SAMN05421504_102960 [Amycolatopsis xylanica]|uniref:Uncharacterized protein n=1 Tax=Amycolatopsis xylanica TaxID=589385 RepID=A0A1H3AL42_9PSEU|nr:hypothetical protein [Amycolatopsis xylanica]SDX30098.1 hypothetical protein SAMN05421504_102960 [Amycolatopsis xylanica]